MRYVLTTPRLVSTSAGIRALYQLANDLRARGKEVRIIEDLRLGHKADPDEIVIYPDCYNGNVLGSRRVVRCIFMYVGYFKGTDKDFDPSEMLFYYSPDMVHNGRDAGNILTIPMIDEARFPYRTDRAGDCYLAIKYKGHFGETPWGVEGAEEVTKETDLAELFGRVRRLITFDNSAINIEAALAGIEVEYRFNRYFESRFAFEDWDWNNVRGSYARQKQRYYEHQLPEFIRKVEERYGP